jgi:hypothetical protein
MKIDLQLAEKKGVRKDERIMVLEKTLLKEKETVRISLQTYIVLNNSFLVSKLQEHY